jgi:hypothetical protein
VTVTRCALSSKRQSSLLAGLDKRCVTLRERNLALLDSMSVTLFAVRFGGNCTIWSSG